jgi:hypothetical protein
VWLAFGALFIKQLIGTSDEETIEQIRENAYLTSQQAPRIATKPLGMVCKCHSIHGTQSHVPPPRSVKIMRAMSKRADLALVENEPEAR